MRVLSGQKTVTTAGTAVPLGTQQVDGMLLVKALDTNGGIIGIGNDGAGDVTLSNSLRLLANDPVIFEHVDNLADIIIDSSINGEGVSWLVLYP